VSQPPNAVDVATALERHAELMLAQGRSDWALLQVRGMARERAGRLIEALADYRLALDLSPADASLMNRIGLSLHGLGQFHEAVFMFDRALVLQRRTKPRPTTIAGDRIGQRATPCCAGKTSKTPSPWASRWGDRPAGCHGGEPR
jgi:tetratricopeptide (TPR) repeat protein